jgi:hypothetical protein
VDWICARMEKKANKLTEIENAKNKIGRTKDQKRHRGGCLFFGACNNATLETYPPTTDLLIVSSLEAHLYQSIRLGVSFIYRVV